MTSKKSLADLLRNHIREQLNQNYDYSLRSNRKADIEIFIQRNQKDLDKKQSTNTIRPSHDKILDEQLKNKGIDPASLGRVPKKPRFNSDLKANITPEPQAGIVDSSPKTKGGTPVPVGQAGVIPVVPETFDTKAVSASINSLYLMLRTVYPDLELLSDEEKDSLGSLWKSAFNKYLTDNFAEIIIPLMATFGIFAPKILEARKKKKLKQTDIKKVSDTQKKDIEQIKKDVKEKTEKEKDSSSQEQQKIKQMIDQNEQLPKTPVLGQVDTQIHIPTGEKVEFKKEND